MKGMQILQVLVPLVLLSSAAPSQAEGQNMGTEFSLQLFHKVEKGGHGNILVSPFSAYMALSMVLNGAEGSTRNEIARVLGVKSGDIEALNQKNKATLETINRNPRAQLELANAIYADSRTKFKNSFIELCKTSYKAEAQREDFNSADTVKKINSWCSQKTHGKIASILDRLSAEEKMVLLNAIYFKAAWQHKFTKSLTVKDKFTVKSGEQIPVEMMHQVQDCLYHKGADFASVALPYMGRQQSMYIFLPDKSTELPAFEAKLTAANWGKWMQSYHMADINLSLPRFTVNYAAQLNDALVAMGMPEAFSSTKANFSNMIEQPTWISRVLQKAFMDVNEDGTEAAAVTSVVMATKAAFMRPEPVVEFRVDRPFIVAIVDNQSHDLLFIARILKPGS